jgi:hypothetical protein
MRNNAKPISTYKVVQTGANTTFGGLNQGLFSEAYHVGIELIVNTVDPNPAIKGTARDTSSLTTSMVFILARCSHSLLSISVSSFGLTIKLTIKLFGRVAFKHRFEAV